MSKNDRWFILAELTALAFIVALGYCLGLQHPWGFMGYAALTWCIAALIFQGSSWRNPAGWWTLLAAWCVLIIGVALNTAWFTTWAGGTDSTPVLINHDAHRAWTDALAWFNDTPPSEGMNPKDRPYGFIVSALWHITGVSIVPPLMLNVLAILITLIAAGGFAQRLLVGKVSMSPGKIAAIAMIATASICYLMAQGMVLIKESLVIMSLSLIAYAATGLRSDLPPIRRRWTVLAAFVLAAVLLPALRMFVAAGAVLIIAAMTAWRSRPRRSLAIGAMVFLIVVMWCMWLLQNLHPDFTPAVDTFNSYSPDVRPDQSVWYSIIDGYGDWSQLVRLLWLPVNALTQFLIPFPWNWTAQLDYGISQVYAHFAWPWYAIGALIIYYFVAAFRRPPAALKRLSVCAILLWLVPAWVVAGTVSRYGLAMLPLAIPAVVYVIDRYRQRKSLHWWLVAYFVLLIAGLIVCHHMMMV